MSAKWQFYKASVTGGGVVRHETSLNLGRDGNRGGGARMPRDRECATCVRRGAGKAEWAALPVPVAQSFSCEAALFPDSDLLLYSTSAWMMYL